MQTIIEHKGVVVSVSDRSVGVRMTVECSCEGCEAVEFCGLSESGAGEPDEDAGSAGYGERTSGRAAQALAVPSSAPAEKLVDVWTDHAAAFAPGEEVVVSVVRVMSVNAVVWTYIVPLLVMLVILVGGKSLGLGDTITGGATLGAGALYYAGLWLLRRRLKRIPIFRLGKL